MNSKVVLLLALAAVIVFLSSNVAGRDLGETSAAQKTDVIDEATTTETNGVDDAKYGGYGGGYPGRGGGYGGDQGGGYGGGYGSGCRYGPCRCCSYAGEATEAEPKN